MPRSRNWFGFIGDGAPVIRSWAVRRSERHASRIESLPAGTPRPVRPNAIAPCGGARNRAPRAEAEAVLRLVGRQAIASKTSTALGVLIRSTAADLRASMTSRTRLRQVSGSASNRVVP